MKVEVHWEKFEVGWTTLKTVPQSGRDRWFSEFQRYLHINVPADVNLLLVEAQLEVALAALAENGQPITEAEDLEASAPILGYSQMTGLPFVVGHAATIVSGSRFQSVSTQGNVTSQGTSQRIGLSQETIALVTQMAHEFQDLRAVVAAQA
ncbi:hypothetical protein QQ045_003295 [Rhodiola kirilowii]